MTSAWQSYRGAPDTGTHVCTLDEFAANPVVSVDLDGFPLLLVRVNKEVRAFVNACPHQHLPLDYRGRAVLSADNRLLRCTNHGAAFSVETGEGVAGLGQGTCLDPVPVDVMDGNVRIGRG